MGQQRLRLDEAIVERKLLESRSRARAFILAGQVRVNGVVADKASAPVLPSDAVELITASRFASRGGEKLAHALNVFQLDVSGRVAADVGASTGGFTDCLLQAGAERVVAIDVGYGQLAERLRRDPRVIVVDRTNVRQLTTLPMEVSLVTVDVSFISLRLVLPVVAGWLGEAGYCLPLIKPQFEAGRTQVGKGGVVRDPFIRSRVLHDVLSVAESAGFAVRGVTTSPLRGPAGNVEYLACLERGQESIAWHEIVAHMMEDELSG